MLRMIFHSLLLLLVLVASVEGTIVQVLAILMAENLITSLPNLISTSMRKPALVTKIMVMFTVSIVATDILPG